MKKKQNPSNLWYSFNGKPFQGTEPAFFDEEQQEEWVKKLEDSLPIMKKELASFLAKKGHNLQAYFNQSIVNHPQTWKTLTFFAWGIKNKANCRACPIITKTLETTPNMVSGSVSMLEPGTIIQPHHGETNGIFRCHLGITIPESLPNCGLEVNGQQHAWEEGKMLLFCDAHKHKAWNLSNQRRFIFIIDVIRPEFVHKKHSICANVVSFLFLQKQQLYIPFLNSKKSLLFKILQKILCPVAFILLPIQRKLASLKI